MAILVIDDSEPVRLLLEGVLKSAGFEEIVLADSARAALEVLQKERLAESGQPIDLVLMDIILPEIDGIEAVRRIRQVEHLRDTPVIMVTSRDDTESLQQALEAGATDYVTKPLDKVALIARARAALRLKKEMDRRKRREIELLKATRQLTEANERLKRLTSLDGLTGIANRRYFDQRLDMAWRLGLRESTPVALAMIDIDFFKLYNDTYGHQNGDECLRRVAQALNQSIQRPADLMARYGGEEFAGLLPGIDIKGAVKVVEMMKDQVTALKIEHSTSTVEPFVTVSIGVASIPPKHGLSSAALVRVADQALYQAKRDGRNQIRLAKTVNDNQQN